MCAWKDEDSKSFWVNYTIIHDFRTIYVLLSHTYTFGVGNVICNICNLLCAEIRLD